MKNSLRATTAFLLLLTAAPVFAAKPGPGALPPSAVIFSNSSFNFGVQPTYTGAVNIPLDGAWLYGKASSGSSIYQDCVHHYEVDLNPSMLSPNYNPLLTLGVLTEADAATCDSFGHCFTAWLTGLVKGRCPTTPRITLPHGCRPAAALRA